jgi:hypothetical protein
MGTWHNTDPDRMPSALNLLQGCWRWLCADGRAVFDDFLWWLGLLALLALCILGLHHLGWL